MQRSFNVNSLRRLLLLVSAAAVATACSLTTDPPAAHAAAIQAGDQQTTTVGTDLPIALAVIVVDQYGFIMPNVGVTWNIQSGGGALSATDTKTNENGISSVTYTAGPTAGTAKIRATIAGVGFLDFTETITAGP